MGSGRAYARRTHARDGAVDAGGKRRRARPMTRSTLLARPARNLTVARRRSVVVASVSAGNGHVRAAEAIVEALRISNPRLQAIHVNVLEHATSGFRKAYEDGYS